MPPHLLPIPPIHTVVEKVELLTDRLITLLAERVLERIPEVPTTYNDHAHGPASHPVADPFPHTVIQSSLQSKMFKSCECVCVCGKICVLVCLCEVYVGRFVC